MAEDFAFDKSLLRNLLTYCELWDQENPTLENKDFQKILWSAVVWKMKSLDGVRSTGMLFFKTFFKIIKGK